MEVRLFQPFAPAAAFTVMAFSVNRFKHLIASGPASFKPAGYRIKRFFMSARAPIEEDQFFVVFLPPEKQRPQHENWFRGNRIALCRPRHGIADNSPRVLFYQCTARSAHAIAQIAGLSIRNGPSAAAQGNPGL